jgi:hypothetical protein
MKIYRGRSLSYNKRLQALKRALAEKQAAHALNYMDVKELSEKMERARVAAQFAILRYKYEQNNRGPALESVKDKVEDYLFYKKAYFAHHKVYLEQCGRPATNQNILTDQAKQ